MIRGIILASAAAIAVAAFSISTPSPVEAKSSCERVSARAVRPSEDWAKMRAEKRLGRYVDRWAKKQGKTVARLSPVKTKCEKRPSGFYGCVAKAKACI